MTEIDTSQSTRRRPFGRFIVVGCAIFLGLLAAAAVVTYLALRPKELSAPLVLALPNCSAGAYKQPAATGKTDVFDSVAVDVQRRACEGSKGLQGTALLSDHLLTLQVHNSDYFPLTALELRLMLKPEHATSYERTYRLEGNVPALGDGELRVSTNLEPKNLQSFSPVVTWAWFDNKVLPADAVEVTTRK